MREIFILQNSIETYKELIKMEPDHTEAHCGLAHAYRCVCVCVCV